MRDGDRHVVPNPGGGWDVKAANAKRASSHHETQAEAVERAREIIRNKGGGELSIHGEDGKVRQKDTVSTETPSRDVANMPSSAQSAPRAAGSSDATGPARGDDGMAQTGRPAAPASATPRPPQQRGSLAARVKGLFSRS